MRLLRFVASTLSVRELLWFPLKSAIFLEIYNTYYWKGKYFKFFLWIRNSAVINNVIVNGGIAIGKDYRFV